MQSGVGIERGTQRLFRNDGPQPVDRGNGGIVSGFRPIARILRGSPRGDQLLVA